MTDRGDRQTGRAVTDRRDQQIGHTSTTDVTSIDELCRRVDRRPGGIIHYPSCGYHDRQRVDEGPNAREPMVITTHVYADHPDLALADTIRTLPDVTLGVLEDAGTDPENSEYVFWIEASDFDAVEAALAEDHTVAAFTQVDEFRGRRTYRIAYSDEATLLTPMIHRIGGITRESRSHANGWMLRLQLQDHDDLLTLDRYARDEGIHLELLDLRQESEVPDRTRFGLTEPQADALAAAYVHGYYDDPREISLQELASVLGLSNTALSGRLRRASERLVEEVLLDEETDRS